MSASRAERRRRRGRRRALVVGGCAVLVIALGAVAVALFGGDGSGGTAPAVAAPGATVPSPVTTQPVAVAPTPAPAPTTTTEPDPAFLPQTADKPTTTSPKFTGRVAALWNAIVADDPAAAMPFFFPLGAYQQVKAISNPESDWRTRLVAAYTEDIHALHAKLGSRTNAAQFTGFDVPDQAQWVQPGEEYNKGSYWRVYDAKLRYTLDGQSQSFPIASMISWRGEWYVVHLNSIR